MKTQRCACIYNNTGKNCSQGLDKSAILEGSMDTWVTGWMALGGGIFIFLTTCGKVKMIQIGRYEKSEVK